MASEGARLTLADGRVLVDGIDVSTLDTAALVALRRRIGMIFQHFNLLSAKTVYANVALPLQVGAEASLWLVDGLHGQGSLF